MTTQDPLSQALFDAVATRLNEGDEFSAPLAAGPEEVASALQQRHGVPSDAFWNAWDIEVAELAARYREAVGVVS